MADINITFLLSLSIIAIGFLIKKAKFVNEETGRNIAKIILNVTLPAQILVIISQLPLDLTLGLLPVISLLFSLSVLGTAFVVFRNLTRSKRGMILMTVTGFNVALFAFPLIEGVYGDPGILHIAMFDIGNAFIIFGLIYAIAAIFSPKYEGEGIKVDKKLILKRILTSLPLISYIVAVIINISGIGLPVFAIDLLNILARANMALTLLEIGIFLDFKFERSQWSTILKVLGIRYIVGLTVGLILFFILPFGDLYRGIVLIALILPVGMATIPFAVEFGYEEKIIVITVSLSIIISFCLMWIMMLTLGIG